ncbi:MAG: hypothetical protein PHE55_03995 [Methylococcaceae bacterium]|nr:hypothetical protein [Methylococcaceae bacterium]
MAFSATWFLLEQEGMLAQACLCNGLTALRRANLGDKKGLFYSAFFELSIGFERVLKLVLILDHMARNKLDPPDSKTVEDFGHKLRSLFDATKVACATHGVDALDVFQANSLPIVILDFLDDFAHPGGRYSNINKLTGHKHQTMADPIVQWGEIANRIMQTHATPKERERAQLNGQMASVVFGDAAASLISDLNQQQMDVAPLHVRAAELDIAAKYAIYALVTLIAALREALDSLCARAWAANPPGTSGMADIPDMKEFFQFAWPNKPYVMRKRQWP